MSFSLRPTLVIVLSLAVATLAQNKACSSFTFTSNNTRLISTTYYEAGSRLTLSTPYESVDTNTLPAFCRVQVEITTNAPTNSTALTEVWLPDDWNGRFLTIGNGGFSGGAAVADLAFVAVQHGFVGMSTNTGHNSSEADGTWAIRNDNALIDFGWRAMHLSVTTAKAVVEKFYGAAPKKAYYTGCSAGGHQGLKQIQLFPNDFDGAVIGSPPNSWTHFAATLVHISNILNPPTSANWIPADTWTNVIHPEVLRQCDELDGIKDGIISNPLLCTFDTKPLACQQDQDPSTCLTQPQIETFKKLYSDYYEVNSTYIYGGFYPGAEPGLPEFILGEEPGLGTNFFRYFITNDTTWVPSQLTAETIRFADELNPGQINANDPDLRGFANHGGKILYYAGWAENLVSAGTALHYYEQVSSFMRSHASPNMDDFYRLFMVPGMAHCLSGDGANAFGAIAQESASMPPLTYDADHDILQALIRWVEEDAPPERITAVHYTNNNVSEGVEFTRPICKYPASPRYVSGQPEDSTSFSCV